MNVSRPTLGSRVIFQSFSAWLKGRECFYSAYDTIPSSTPGLSNDSKPIFNDTDISIDLSRQTWQTHYKKPDGQICSFDELFILHFSQSWGVELKTTVWPSKSKTSLEATKFIKTDSTLRIAHGLKQCLALTIYLPDPYRAPAGLNQQPGGK